MYESPTAARLILAPPQGGAFKHLVGAGFTAGFLSASIADNNYFTAKAELARIHFQSYK